MLTANEALERLKNGNHRCVHEPDRCGRPIDSAHRDALVDGQAPFAIVLGCSDSRVPAEIVFDSGLGDLFVIRVAGNVVTPSQLGSAEFAAQAFGTRLVVVLGHSNCGAVQATLQSLADPTCVQLPNLHAIVDQIRPAVQPLALKAAEHDADELLQEAVRANVRTSAEQLRHGSSTLERLIRDEGLLVVGAEYSLETGVVEFFDGMPDTDG